MAEPWPFELTGEAATRGPNRTMATTLVELLGQRVATEPASPYFHVYDETVTYGALWRESARHER